MEGYKRASLPDKDVIHVIYRKSTTAIIGKIRVQLRSLLFKVVCGKPYLIVGLHLAAMENGSQRRQEQVRQISGFIRELLF